MNGQAQDFRTLLERVKAYLSAERRVSYRGLKRQFGLTDDDLEDIKDELIHARKLARDEDGRVLVWDGGDAELRSGIATQYSTQGYAPRHLVDQILSSRASIEGERKQATVLFCDVVRSMDLAERLGAEEWHALMNEMFAVLAEAVHFLEGTISQYTGDGLLALFGAPIGAEDHALKACLAGLRICTNTRRLSERLQEKHGETISVRVGLNSGEVIVGSIGEDLRMDYTAQGHVVGVGKRMESMSAPNTVTLSEFSARLVCGLCELESLGMHKLKGLSRPIELFKLQKANAEANRFDVSRDRGLSPFVGRDAELLMLEAALKQSQQGFGQVVEIVADAGTGKSRLCYEFLQRCKARGLTVMHGYALPHGRNIPYLPVRQALRDYFGISEALQPALARQRIDQRLSAVDPELLKFVPLVHELMEVADPQRAPPVMDADAKQRQIFSILAEVVRAVDPKIEGFVVCIEDLHWMDQASAEFIRHWVSAVAGSRVMLILAYRPEYSSPWVRAGHCRQLQLAPLDAIAMKQMLADVLGADPSVRGLADEIYKRSAGNPFFCEEIVQSLRESGALGIRSATYHLTGPLEEVEIPATVQALLAARIDRLSADIKAVVQVASVIGREFSQALLAQVINLGDSELKSHLSALRAGGFIFAVDDDAAGFEFKHALTQEVARNSQLKQRRRQVHARVAQAIEELHADHADEVAALLAYHWDNAGERLQAARAYVRAAQHLASGIRTQEMSYLRRALELTQDLPQSDDRQNLRLQILTSLMSGGAWRFDMSDDELEAQASEARSLAESAGMTDLAVLVRAGHMAALGMMRGYVDRWGPGMDAVAELLDGVSAESRGAVIANQSYSKYVRGELAASDRLMRQACETAQGDYQFGRTAGWSILAAGKNSLALTESAMGKLEQALQTHRTGLAETEDAGLVEELIWQLSNFADEIYPFGDAPEHPRVKQATDDAKRGLEMAERVASDFTRGLAMRGRGISLLLSADYPAADRALRRCLEHCRERRAHLEVESEVLAFLAEAKIGLKQFDDAQRCAQAAIDRAKQQGALYFEALAQVIWVKSWLMSGSGIAKPASLLHAALERAQVLMTRTGGLAIQPQIHEMRAGLLAADGQEKLARMQLDSAIASARKIGAEGHALRFDRVIAGHAPLF